VRLLPLLVTALLVGACSAPAAAPPPASAEPVQFAECGDLGGGEAKLPDISLPCFTGGQAVRAAQLRGPLVINFWASWCPPCRKELPAFQRLADSGRVKVIGVATDDRREAALSVAAELGVKFPTLFDAKGELRRAQGEAALPLTLFVTSQGEVSAYTGPALTNETLGALVARRLDGAA
jgi:thiol-disulfide isomerase/thioredoxin